MTSNTRKFRVFFGDPDLPQMFAMFLPIFIDRILNSLIGTVHSYFVAGEGETVISAISLVNQVNHLITIVFFCACGATMIVISQLNGAGLRERACMVVGNTLAFTVYGTIVIAILFYLFPSQVMTLFFGETDPAILAEAIKYIRLLGISLPFSAAFQTCASSCRGYDEHKIPMYISVSGSIVNLVGAFIFIKLFKLGISGAALGLVFSNLYMAVTAYIVLKKRNFIAPIKKCLHIDFTLIKNVLYLGFFSSTESIITSFAGTLKTGFLVPFGISHITASSVLGTFSGLLDAPSFVMTTLVTNYVAKAVGKNDSARAREMLLKCYIYNLTLSAIAWTAAYFVLPHLFPLYTQNPATLELLSKILIIYAIGTPLISIFLSTIRSAFNGAGDAKFATISSIACMLVFNLGLGYALIKVFELGVIGSILSAYISGLVKALIYIFRYKSGRWEKHVMV